MHVLDQRAVGIAILALLGMLVGVKRLATGSVLGDRPDRGAWLWAVHIFNLSFLLVASPLAAVLLVLRRLYAVDPTRLPIDAPSLLIGAQIAGLGLSVGGYLLMAWALLTLRRNYQPGGSAPRLADTMVVGGPYRYVRHPMYTAALSVSLGLACLTQSIAYLAVFCVYLVLIVRLIPVEEDALRRSYGARYVAYQQDVNRLLPWLY